MTDCCRLNGSSQDNKSSFPSHHIEILKSEHLNSDGVRDTPARTSQKRRQPSYHNGDHLEIRDGFNADDLGGGRLRLMPARKKRRTTEVPLKCIVPPPLAFPKSAYAGHTSSTSLLETSVIDEILAEDNETFTTPSKDSESFVEADLEAFSIYHAHKSTRSNQGKRVEEAPQSNELVSLHEKYESSVKDFRFDGIICDGAKRRHVQDVPFEILSIGGYGNLDRPTVGSDIWIQSVEGQKSGVWYRLKSPAPEYRRYHDPFLWMTDLAKHVTDYLSVQNQVTLDHFREMFHEWLQRLHGTSHQLHQWLGAYGRKDFRGIIAAQASFLYCQAVQWDAELAKYALWSEIDPRSLGAIQEQTERGARPEMFALSKEGLQTVSRRKTTVTPYVYDCFRHMPWEKFLYRQVPTVGPLCASSVGRLDDKIGYPLSAEETQARAIIVSDLKDPIEQNEINIGDVVALPRDNDSVWKTSESDWYGYVQSLTDSNEGRKLGILWLYRPSDTQCLKMHYPFSNELFLSDHCNCGDPPVFVRDVTRKPLVAFFSSPDTKCVDFFVRHRYVQGDGSWESLEKSHFNCDCKTAKLTPPYMVGDTLLVKIRDTLEPVTLVKNNPDGIAGKARVRRLLRKNMIVGYANAAPNELVITNRILVIPQSHIYRRCQVRIYTREDKENGKIPCPYDRHGTGDFYYILFQALDDDIENLKAVIRPLLLPLNEAWDPLAVSPYLPMRGLDIFSGGGNLGRGLEEGGAVHFEWVVDWCNEAIHTYKANLKDQDSTMLFYGSVNDYLTQALRGKAAPLIAQRGQVDSIAAGNPCQGYSQANNNRANDRSLLNASMVASVVAYVDFYRPKYAIVENVKGMATGSDTNNVLAQVICAFVGMGYQLRTFALDAWNYGSPQSRSRIFISIAAAGLTPLPEPPHTHSHPASVIGASLGRTANGLRTSSRYTTLTPFDFVTSREATRDLPRTDARTLCIPFPDHRMSSRPSTLSRVRISSIPRFPGGSTFMSAFSKGYMPQAQIDGYAWDNQIRTRKDSKSWQRVKRDALMPTIMTVARPWDGVTGNCLHWDDHRLLTIMEVRRAQGYPDDEVIVGLPSEQWKIVGNSVARPVALTLGLSLRTAWLENNARPQTVAAIDKTVALKTVNG